MQNSSRTTSPSNDDDTDLERGDLPLHSFFENQTSCILDVRITDSDIPSYSSATPEKVLTRHEKEKKKKYLDSCHEQRRHFMTCVCDTYGLLAEEAVAVNKKLAVKLASKWKSPYSVTCGFVNARISIAILQASQLCIRGSRVPYRHNMY